jgi:hypothetical protein
MTALNAASAVATALQTAGKGTLGSTIFIGLEAPSDSLVPISCIFVVGTGGPPPDDFLGDTSKRGIKHHRVQVLVRGARNDFQAGAAAALGALEALNLATVSGVLKCGVEQSEPAFLGLNDQEQPRWTINVMLDAMW